jgi:hypothetical protein
MSQLELRINSYHLGEVDHRLEASLTTNYGTIAASKEVRKSDTDTPVLESRSGMGGITDVRRAQGVEIIRQVSAV